MNAKKSTKYFSALAAGGAAALMLATPAFAAHEGSSYSGTLTELNGSGGSGKTTITVSEDGETMTVKLDATGLNLDGPHAMHIHGLVDGETVSASACPTMADDADGDGVLTVAEGAPKYGGIQVSLTTTGDTSPESGLAVDRFPAGTTVTYERSGIAIPAAVKPNLGKLHVVMHGIDENGNGTLDLDQTERSSLTADLPREATAPALCGTLTAVATGAIQTGAGGTATDDGGNSSTGLALGAAAAAGLAATAIARPRFAKA